MAITTEVFHRGPGKAASVVAAMGSVGGMILPWLQGMLLENHGPSASVVFVAIGGGAMLTLYIGVSRLGLAVRHLPAVAAAGAIDPE
jgi:fucose permease